MILRFIQSVHLCAADAEAAADKAEVQPCWLLLWIDEDDGIFTVWGHMRVRKAVSARAKCAGLDPPDLRKRLKHLPWPLADKARVPERVYRNG